MEKKFEISDEVLDSMLEGIKTQEDLFGENGLISQLSKSLLERMLNAEMDYHLDDRYNLVSGRASGNSRNGRIKKTVKSELGNMEIFTPRDRQSTFEPHVIPKRSTRIGKIDDAIISLYSKGMTVRDIQSTLEELYQTKVSPALISQITEAIQDEVTEWQDRPLEAIYPIVWLDAITVKVHQDRQIEKKSIYVALGVNLEGQKELLGLWIAETEGAKFWSQVLTDLNNRGVKDVFVFCVDGLKGFPEAISGVFPSADVQLCVVHMVRNSLKKVPWKDRKEVARDLRDIYRAGTLEGAEQSLKKFGEKWDTKYPMISSSWQENWENLVAIYKYPAAIRNVIYTTNAIESLNSVIRKGIRNRRIFPSDESALKLVWMTIAQASKKWTMPIPNWQAALNFFYVHFGDRIPLGS